MAEGSDNQSQAVIRGKNNKELRSEMKKRKEETKKYMDKLRGLLPSAHVESIKIVESCSGDTDQKRKHKPLTVPFAIKAANDSKGIECQVIKYIKEEIPKKEIKVKKSFDWTKRDHTTPLVVFCNYSSRIGVDVKNALRGVEEQQVILIILHCVRRALLKGDLSDDDELLSDDLKKRTVFITHFAFDAFDDKLYDCEQNRQARCRLIRDLKQFLNIEK